MSEEAGESVDVLSESAEGLGESIDGIGDGSGDNLSELAESAEEAGESMGEAEGNAISLASALKTLFAAISMAAIIGTVKDFASSSIDIGKNFTSMMSEVQAISGASTSDIAQLEETARQYGATTVFSATEAAEALKYMSLAGWDANQSTEALGGVLNLAAASGMELGQSSDMVTDYLSAFGMKANEATYLADLLSYAQSNSNTTAEQLGEAYRNSAANMHAAGQDVETTTSLLEAMANQGYKGSEAGTALAATMRDITQKMDNGKIKIGDTSIAVQDAKGNFRDLTDILTDVESATDGMGDAQKAAALGSTFTADSIKAMNMIMTEGMDNVSGYEEALRHADGAAEKMASTMNDNLNGDMANMNSAFEEMQLQVFEQMEEPLREGAQYITNDIIPILTDWVPDAFGAVSSGIATLGNASKPLFETILKNPQAVSGAFASMAAGFLALKGVNTAGKIANVVSNMGSLSSTLGKFSTTLFGSPWAAGAAAVATAVAGIGFAVKEYNKLQINESLAEHFGNVELDESQIQDFASRIIDAEWITNINTALGHFENADNLAKQAQEALAENDAIEWKARVGIELTADDKETYSSNIQESIQAKLDELEERTYAAELSVSTSLKSPEGKSLADSISKWAAEDMADVSKLQQQLTNLVEAALTDGIIDVNEQAAIDTLQGKINTILSGWESSEAQAEMDLITQKYGRMSGKDLTSDTFASIVTELGEQRKSAADALEADSKEFYGIVNGLVNSGRLSESQGEDYKQQFVSAVRNSEANTLVNSLGFEGNTLSDTYGEKLQENYANIQESTGDFLSNANNYLAEQDYDSLVTAMSDGYSSAMTSSNVFSDGDQKALAQLYETMKPDAAAMGDLIDEYRSAGQAVPEEVMSSFNEAMQIGAAAGDADAAWAVFAQQMVSDPASKALVQGIQEGTIGVPEELRTAIERATAETTDEPVTIDGMTAELDNIEVDNAKVQELLNKAMEGVEATGNTKTLDGGEIAVEYEVTSGQTLSEIAEQAGVALDELLAANPQIENPNAIEVGQKINIPASKVETDTSGVAEATEKMNQEAQKTADEANSKPLETSQEVNKTYEKGEEDKSDLIEETTIDAADPVEQQVPTTITFEVASLDNSEISAAMSKALAKQEAVPVKVPANIKVKVGEIDDSELSSSISNSLGKQEAVPVKVPANITVALANSDISTALADTKKNLATAFSTPFPVNGTTNVTLAKASDNIASVYSQVGNELRSKFASGYSVSTNASIHVNYSIANPSASISFGGGGTGNAKVSASLHALGGYFDQPHLGIVAEAGGEYIIPMNGSDRSKNMWFEAGNMLGIDSLSAENMQLTSNMKPVTTQEVGKPIGETSSEKTINVNVNGSGNMRISGTGASKEQIVDVMLENLKEVFMSIVQEEIIEEGDGVYEF